MSTALSLDWLRKHIEALGVEGHWQAVARTTLRDNIYDLQRTLEPAGPDGRQAPEACESARGLARAQSAAVEYVRKTINEMRALPQMDFATLSVALQAVSGCGMRRKA